MFAPRWLFFYPGIALVAIGVALALVLLPGPVQLTPAISLDVHSFLVASIMALIGVQCISFAVVARRYAASRGLLPNSEVVKRVLVPITLERVLIVAVLVSLLGLFGVGWCVLHWAREGFGQLQYGSLIRLLTISLTAIAMGLQLAFTAFLSEIIEIGR
jgi:hypothetical protein